MRLHRLSSEQFLPIPLEEAWAFFSSPVNLERITPPWLNLKPTCPLPGEMHPGMIVTYAVAPLPGVRVNWVTEITHVVPGSLFVDEQRAGPYRFWHHQHHFRAVPGGTLMTDIVHYALPFGLAGDALGSAMVKRRVRGIFDYREEVLARLFGGSTRKPVDAMSPAAAVGLA
jgi:ligand-binding SRPBCC domain-containing protein